MKRYKIFKERSWTVVRNWRMKFDQISPQPDRRVMSLHKPWIETFQVTPEALGSLHAQADPHLSLLHSALLAGLVPEQDYLNWAMSTYQLPSLEPNFSPETLPDWESVSSLFQWRQDYFPAGQWGNTLYVLCHEPAQLEITGYRIQHVLAPASFLKACWTTYSPNSNMASEASSVPKTAEASSVPKTAEASSVPEGSVPEGLSLGESAALEESSVPEGIHLGESAALEESSVPEGSPEGIHLGESAALEESSVPEGSPEGIHLGESAALEESSVPEGLSGGTSSVSVSFASLVNPVQASEQVAASGQTASSEQAAPSSSNQLNDDSKTPVILLAPQAEEEPAPKPAPATPKSQSAPSKTSSPADLSSLKVRPEDAAQLPPLPQPFGAQATHFPEPEAPARQAAPAAQATSAAPTGEHLKTAWTLAEVSKVTPLKQDQQTVSRTLEFTHLTSSGGQQIQMCRAVSNDEVAQASDDVRKARDLEELSLNTFRLMQNYFTKSVFLVFLGGGLLPWRWTQNWSRTSGTPPGPMDLSTPSIFRIAFQTSLPYHGYVVPSPVNDAFFKEWNQGVLPDHVTLMPVKAGNLIAGMILGVADRASIDYKYSLKFMEGLSVNISQTLQDLAVKTAS